MPVEFKIVNCLRSISVSSTWRKTLMRAQLRKFAERYCSDTHPYVGWLESIKTNDAVSYFELPTLVMRVMTAFCPAVKHCSSHSSHAPLTTLTLMVRVDLT